ncbi:hypothetical protein LCGC14_1774660 [marine sediment metagenome]|uniref:Uncharacterized protein n=1 Tax=marine sediment metagenome TaxID=412755 RepID=A0A0F9GXC2_9ZZZZ|nr:hypothetical protein [Methylophaga sp.]
MKVTEIQIDGKKRKIRITSKTNKAAIFVEKDHQEKLIAHIVINVDNIWDLACRIQIEADGYQGCGGDVEGYRIVLSMFCV